MPYVRILSRPSTRCCHLVSSFSTRRLFRAPSRSPPLDPFGPSRLPGSLPSSRQHPSESTYAALPKHPLRSVRRRSQPLDGLLLTRAPRFISPSSRVQGCFVVQGLLSPCSAPPSSGDAAPLPLPFERFAGSCDPTPTLGRLGFEALLHTEKRSHRLGVEPGQRPLPSSRSISSRFTAPTDRAAASPLPTARGISTHSLCLRKGR
jgi:hypothetical protein